MYKCPRCGYVDPAAAEAARRYDAKRGSRAEYMREYRARKKADAKKPAKKERKP